MSKTPHQQQPRFQKCADMQRHAFAGKTALQRLCRLDIDSTAAGEQNTAILCTVGPACRDPKILADMTDAGMGVARINLSHGTLVEHKESIRLLKEVDRLRKNQSEGAGVPIAIAVETRGRKIRTGSVAGDAAEVAIATGSRIRLECGGENPSPVCANKIWLSFAELPRLAKQGQKVFIDNGLLQLRVTEARPADASVDCLVEVGGMLGSNKSVHLPGLDTGLPDLTPEDYADLKALATDSETAGLVNIVIGSFINIAETVKTIKATMVGSSGTTAPLIVAKIADMKSFQALDDILKEADAILIARGDLGVEIAQSKVFAAQKRIIARCCTTSKASICSTHLLGSMVKHARPTRAEIADVANTVLDGIDCLMLSAETATGSYPVAAVRMLAKTCCEAEAALYAKQQTAIIKRQMRDPADPLQSSAMAACEAAIRCHASVILIVADHARLSRLVAMYRPPCPIVTVCRDSMVCHGLNLWCGVHPLHYDGDRTSSQNNKNMDKTNRRLRFGAIYAQRCGLLKLASLVVVLVEKSAGNMSDLLAVTTSVRLLADDGRDDENG